MECRVFRAWATSASSMSPPLNGWSAVREALESARDQRVSAPSGGTDDELDAAAGIRAGRPGGSTAQVVKGKGKGKNKGKSSSAREAAGEGGMELPPVAAARRPS